MESRAVKRRAQFNEAGDRFEPFSMAREVKMGIVNRDGFYKLKRERDAEVDLQQDDEEYLDDPWLKSIAGDLRQKAIEQNQNEGQ